MFYKAYKYSYIIFDYVHHVNTSVSKTYVCTGQTINLVLRYFFLYLWLLTRFERIIREQTNRDALRFVSTRGDLLESQSKRCFTMGNSCVDSD